MKKVNKHKPVKLLCWLLIFDEKILGWTHEQLLNTINDFTLNDLKAFIPQLLTQNIFIESIMYGNLTEEVLA